MASFSYDSPSILRLGTLTSLRWFAVAGQVIVLATVRFVLGFELPVGPVLALIAAGAGVNLYATFAFSPARPLSEREIVSYLSFDTLQISSILFLTGGINNPFSLWLIMQAMLASSNLPLRRASLVIGIVIASLTFLALQHQPLPWTTAAGFSLPRIYNLGIWTGLMLGVAFTSAYAYRVASEHRKLTAALGATQSALSREERLSALDGLAAAAAHELGTPLGTIQVTAHEMASEVPEGPLREDAELLVSQAKRCQKILKRLSQSGQAGDAVHNVITLDTLLREAARPFLETPGKQIAFRFDSDSGAVPDQMERRPEAIYGLRNLIENAVKYANNVVELSASWDDQVLTVTVSDDGPGIPSETMIRLGEPYPRSGSRANGKGGLGLGFFIAKTLLERTGGVLSFGNHNDRSGAWVGVTWPLAELIQNPTSQGTPRAQPEEVYAT
ncbi:MAG: ActS/PrrB/RegB family redox-sensitive histidine kinase [Pseudomonadota bacterium]